MTRSRPATRRERTVLSRGCLPPGSLARSMRMPGSIGSVSSRPARPRRPARRPRLCPPAGASRATAGSPSSTGLVGRLNRLLPQLIVAWEPWTTRSTGLAGSARVMSASRLPGTRTRPTPLVPRPRCRPRWAAAASDRPSQRRGGDIVVVFRRCGALHGIGAAPTPPTEERCRDGNRQEGQAHR